MAQQLTRIGEPPHIANLDHECSGADQPDPTQHLQMLRHRANGQSIRLSSMAFSSRRTRSRPCVSARISSCRTAAPRKRETDLLQPAQIFGASGRQARINLAVSQQERSYLLRFAGAASYGGLTGADQATHGFVGDVRCPDLVNSPDRDRRASISAFRRFVLVRSPARRWQQHAGLWPHPIRRKFSYTLPWFGLLA